MWIDGTWIQFFGVFEMMNIGTNFLPGNIFRQLPSQELLEKIEELIQV